MRTVTILAALVCSVTCLSSPPARALVVSKNAAAHEFSSISAAVAALSTEDTEEQVIFIHQGTYTEQVLIDRKLAGPLSIYGESSKPSNYSGNTVTITAGESLDSAGTDDASGTFRVHIDDVKVYNINVVNNRGNAGQAIALSAYGNQGYYACQFRGYQDTLLTNQGTQLYSLCYIEGLTDFIFGMRPQAWFEQCTIGVLGGKKGYITASGNKEPSNSYIVINKSEVKAATNADPAPKPRTIYLGRPWGLYAATAFQFTSLSDIINPDGWTNWRAGQSTDNVKFGEWENTGDGSKGDREIGHTLDGPVAITTVLGDNYKSAKWVDSSYPS